MLTEWKVVRKLAEYESLAAAGWEQAGPYAFGSLAGIEPAAHRYTMLVSQPALPAIADVPAGGLVYRHINVPVDPAPPPKG